HLIHTAKELREIVNQLHGRPYMFQQFISTRYGKDLRLHFVVADVAAAINRTYKKDLKSIITTVGTMEAYNTNQMEKEQAMAGTKAIGADFAGVDLLFGKDGPIICEINSNAHIRNMYDCTNINVADFIIDYIIDTLHAEKA